MLFDAICYGTNEGESILDLVLTTNPHIVKVVASEPFESSDHNIVKFEIEDRCSTVVCREEYYD